MKVENSYIRIIYESFFVEEAVFLASKYNINELKSAIIQEFHKARENIYLNTMTEERNFSFERLYNEYFNKFRINETFENAVLGFPLLHQPDVTLFVKKVWCKKEEDTELFVDGKVKTVCIALMANRILQPFSIQAGLRHDLLRISDMLDPKFQYTPHISLAGKNELEDNLIKDRFRILWDIYIDARLRKGGYSVMKTVEEQKLKYRKAFFFLKESEQEYVYSKLDGCENLMQIDLINWAQDARSIKMLGEGGLRCPLCEFTSFDLVIKRPKELLCVLDEIKNDHPCWVPEQGVCPQCFDLYNCRIKAKA